MHNSRTELLNYDGPALEVSFSFSSTEKPGDISPGEKQLIGVARAVLRKSRVVALDEVTSRVDKAAPG